MFTKDDYVDDFLDLKSLDLKIFNISNTISSLKRSINIPYTPKNKTDAMASFERLYNKIFPSKKLMCNLRNLIPNDAAKPASVANDILM